MDINFMFLDINFLFSSDPGELDHLPEVAFYMVGPIEEVALKADKLAAERAAAM